MHCSPAIPATRVATYSCSSSLVLLRRQNSWFVVVYRDTELLAAMLSVAGVNLTLGNALRAVLIAFALIVVRFFVQLYMVRTWVRKMAKEHNLVRYLSINHALDCNRW